MILSYAKASNVFGLSDMQSKDLATIRVSNLSPSLGERAGFIISLTAVM